jgi:hypothetical protein
VPSDASVGGDAAGVVRDVQHAVGPGDRAGDVGAHVDPPLLLTGVGVERRHVGVAEASLDVT